jgi:DUF4097 and DUF4098 domain-containing protein YvlB
MIRKFWLIAVTVAMTWIAGGPAAAAQVASVLVRSGGTPVEITGSESATEVTGTGKFTIDGTKVTATGKTPVKLIIPIRAELMVKTISGNIIISKVQGALSCKSISGDITLRGASAGITLKTISGQIVVHDGAGQLRLKSVSGDVVARGSFSRTQVKTVSGNIQVNQLKGAASVYTTSGQVTLSGSLSKGTQNEISSHSGNVSLDAQVEDGVSYDASSHSGKVKLALGATAPLVDSGRRAQGVFGSADQTKLRLSTFSGSITARIRR